MAKEVYYFGYFKNYLSMNGNGYYCMKWNDDIPVFNHLCVVSKTEITEEEYSRSLEQLEAKYPYNKLT